MKGLCQRLSLVVLLGAGLQALAEDGWRVVRTETDGLVLEARDVSDTRFPELRVTGHSTASPFTLAEAAWRWNERGVEAKLVERRLVLLDAPRERLVWQVLRPPVVSRRESLVRAFRTDARNHVSITFASEPGPPPEKIADTVRVPLIRGDWQFEADPAGGTRVQHRCVSDPGGGVPPWLARGAQEDIIISLVRETLLLAVERQPSIVGSIR
jgi:hypothetical protein